ncbi:MAG: hypothetical protein RSC68_34295, partial [Acinetobacter sp.]
YLGGTGTAHARPDPHRSFAGFLISAANAARGRGIGRWGLGCMGVQKGGVTPNAPALSRNACR